MLQSIIYMAIILQYFNTGYERERGRGRVLHQVAAVAMPAGLLLRDQAYADVTIEKYTE